MFDIESGYIDIYKLCFLLRRKERKRQIGKLAMKECDILFQFTPHRTTYVTAKMRYSAVMVLAKQYTAPHM